MKEQKKEHQNYIKIFNSSPSKFMGSIQSAQFINEQEKTER